MLAVSRNNSVRSERSEVNYTDDEDGTFRPPTLKELHAAAASSTRRSKRPDRLGDFATHDDLVEINGRKVNDPISWIKDDEPDNMAKRAANEKERNKLLAKFKRMRAAAQERYDSNPTDRKAKYYLTLARERVQAAKKHIEVAKRKLREYDAQHPP
tara:strand:- start:160 stop:627 length:468 start_codon:yes stop_codon:yes gene_type:complete